MSEYFFKTITRREIYSAREIQISNFLQNTSYTLQNISVSDSIFFVANNNKDIIVVISLCFHIKRAELSRLSIESNDSESDDNTRVEEIRFSSQYRNRVLKSIEKYWKVRWQQFLNLAISSSSR